MEGYDRLQEYLVKVQAERDELLSACCYVARSLELIRRSPDYTAESLDLMEQRVLAAMPASLKEPRPAVAPPVL